MRSLQRVVRLYPVTPLIDVAQATAATLGLIVYDALYLSLAASLGAPVLTADCALGRAPGARLLREMPGTA